MCRLKLALSWLFSVILTSALSQTMPAECLTPPTGYTVGGNFTLSGTVNNAICIGSPASISAISPTGISSTPKYNFNYTGGSITAGLTTSNIAPTYTTAGIHYVLQVSTDASGNNVIRCKPLEVIQTYPPDVTTSFCGNVGNVTIRNTPNNGKAHSIGVYWGDGSSSKQFVQSNAGVMPSTPLNHAYSTPHADVVIATVYYSGGSQVCNGPAITIAGTPKIIELQGLNNGSEAQIKMASGKPTLPYRIQYREASIPTYTNSSVQITPNTSTSGTVSGLDPTKTYCFRLQETDPACPGNVRYSNEVCGIKLTADVRSTTDVNYAWSPPSALLLNQSISITNNTGTTTFPAAGASYLYNLMDCGKTYKATVNATYNGIHDQDPTVKVISPEVTALPLSGAVLPALVAGYTSVVNANTTRVNILPSPNITQYTFYKEDNAGNLTALSTTPNTFYIDATASPTSGKECYRVKYADNCGNTSAVSAPFCTIFATSKQPNTLNWTPFEIVNSTPVAGSPLSYAIEVISPSGVPLNSPYSTLTTVQDVKAEMDKEFDKLGNNGKASFRVFGFYRANGFPFPFMSYSNIYTFNASGEVFIPSAFSPNGDGINDDLLINTRFITSFNLKIFDRWGNILFETTNTSTSWNGKDNKGNALAIGSYSYKMVATDINGKAIEKSGSINLLR